VAPAHYSSFRGHEVYREVQGAGSSGGDLAGMERDEAESATAPNVQRSLKFKLLLLGGPGRSPAKRENSVKLPKFHALELNAPSCIAKCESRISLLRLLRLPARPFPKSPSQAHSGAVTTGAVTRPFP